MTAPPVIVRAPHNLGPVEILVRHEDYGVEVDVRPANTSQSWTPISLMGGEFEIRSS